MNTLFDKTKLTRKKPVNTSNCFLYGRWILATVLLLVWIGQAQAQVDNKLLDETGQRNPADLGESLKIAMWDMAEGHFDQARKHLNNFSDSQGRYVRLANDLLGQYETLQSEIHEAHYKAYKRYLKEMNDAVGLAKWRKRLLESSRDDALESEDKSTFETEFKEKARGHWLKALGQMSLASSLADRVGLTDTIDQDLQNDIVTASLKIAQDYESRKKWLDSYLRVYSY